MYPDTLVSSQSEYLEKLSLNIKYLCLSCIEGGEGGAGGGGGVRIVGVSIGSLSKRFRARCGGSEINNGDAKLRITQGRAHLICTHILGE